MKLKWLGLVVISLFLAIGAKAQTATDVQPFTTWLSQQQAYVGSGYFIEHDKAKYVTTSWNLIQYGTTGMNLAQPSLSKDLVDLGPINALANGRAPRWGVTMPLHFGNWWNTIKFSPAVESHINRTALPPFIVAPAFMLPESKGLNKWQWSDFMVMFSLGFGGGS